MSEKYQGKYRSESARLQNWNYGSDGAYFITICTKDRKHYFGTVEKGKMHVSPAGVIAYVLWNEIKNHVQNVDLGEFVVMPNHVHGILILKGKNDIVNDGMDVGGGIDVADGRDVACNVSTDTDTDTGPDIKSNEQMSLISPKPNTVSTIIRSYKSAVTRYCNRLDLPFSWQTRFHDHIIRNEESFGRISEYIKNNPTNWKDDKLY